jgi:hypothetical protein
MPTREHYLEQIERELSGARDARASGNDGKARVCARRAAGCALTWFLSVSPRDGWGVDAMRQLQAAAAEASFPAAVREAAQRLSTKISERFDYPFTADPIGDAELIIGHVRHIVEGGHAGAS